MANAVVHFEIHGSDAKKLQRFYSALFGWTIDDDNPLQYGIVHAEGEGIAGGICESPAAPKVTVYVGVDDLKQALEKVAKLGGRTLLEPHSVPGGPEIALFQDPQGNAVGLVRSTS
jgi:predicted enzyme related to lactoylglutathione lyase